MPHSSGRSYFVRQQLWLLRESSEHEHVPKCYNVLILKQEQAKFAASSIENIVNRSSSGNEKESAVADTANVQEDLVQLKAISVPSSNSLTSFEAGEPKAKGGPSRCNSCKNKVGLTEFKCRCGNLFCGSHHYLDKHDCPFDYRGIGQDAIAKANPVVKVEKLDKI